MFSFSTKAEDEKQKKNQQQLRSRNGWRRKSKNSHHNPTNPKPKWTYPNHHLHLHPPRLYSHRSKGGGPTRKPTSATSVGPTRVWRICAAFQRMTTLCSLPVMTWRPWSRESIVSAIPSMASVKSWKLRRPCLLINWLISGPSTPNEPKGSIY